MSRPRLRRRIRFSPSARFFKPQGIPMPYLEQVELSHEELEALRLKHVKNMDQIQAAKEMNTSQSTFQRILSSAQKKVAEALVKGKSIKIE